MRPAVSSPAVDRVVGALASHGCDPRPCGSAWSFRCPMHENHKHGDRRPSGWLTVNGDGKVCATCKACGPDADPQLLAAVGLTFADLYDDPRRSGSSRKPATTIRKASKRPTARKAHATLPAAIAAAARSADGQAGDCWTYHAADGAELMYVLRVELPDDKTYRPIHRAEDGYRLADPPGLLPLYGLPELIAADPTEPVNVHEGEKCIDADRALGRTATTSSHGSQSAPRTDWAPLAGRDVRIYPDNDPPGRKYADAVAAILVGLDPPACVKIVQLPWLPEGADVVDLIDDRRVDGKDDAAIRREIDDLAAAAHEWTPPGAPLQPPPANPTDALLPDQVDKASADKYVRAIFSEQETFRTAGLRLCRLLARFYDGGGFEHLGLVHHDRYGRQHKTLRYFANPWGVTVRQVQRWIETGRLAEQKIDDRLVADLIPDASEAHVRALLPLVNKPEQIETACDKAQRLAADEAVEKGRQRVRVVARHYRAAVADIVPPKPGKARRASEAPPAGVDPAEAAEVVEAAGIRRRIVEIRNDAAVCPDLPKLVADVLALAARVAGMIEADVPDGVRRAIHEADRLARQGRLGGAA